MSDDSPLSSTDEPINPTVPSGIGKHIYFDEEHDDNEDSTVQKIIERPAPSTVRVDSSDLISRCKDFIPLLSDANQNSIDKEKSNENISLEKEDEINLPDIDTSEKSSKESGEASSTTDDEKIKKKRKKKKKKKKKKLKTNDDLNQDVNVNN